MSHQEKIERMNAELNTSDTWARRWQIEREHNERLLRQAGLVREAVYKLKSSAVTAYSKHRTNAAAARATGDDRSLRVHERMLIIQSARTAALDDLLEMIDAVSREP